jgi:hypothetical protein
VGANTVTLTVTDVNGNDATCTATVTVEDNVAPEAICQNIAVQLDATGNASIAATDIDGGSSDNCEIASMSVSPDAFTCADVGANTVTLTVTDVNGNIATCTANVTVGDNTPPTAVCQDITIQLDATGNASISAADIDGGSSDSCGIDSFTASQTAFTCADVGANTVTLTVTDVSGNSATCTATVTVEDNIAPTAVCRNITVQLDATGNASVTAGELDGGSTDNCGIASMSASPTAFTCADVGPNTVSLTVTDVNGNTSSCTATVTVVDNTPPIAVCQDITIQLNAEGNSSITAAQIDGGSSDACGIAGLKASQTAFTCADLGPNSVTLTVTDVNGNSSTCVAIVAVEDNIPPEIDCDGMGIVMEAGEPIAARATALPTATDNCGPVTLDHSDVDEPYCGLAKTVRRTWVATDPSGNTATCEQIIVLQDTTPPLLMNFPPDTTVACGEIPPEPAEVTAQDTGDPDPSVHFSEIRRAAEPFILGFVTIRTWLALDACGNSVMQSQTILESPCEEWPGLCIAKFYDANVDGQLTEGDVLVPDWQIKLINSAGQEYVTTTGSSGQVCLPNLPPDLYTVVEQFPSNARWYPSTAPEVQVDLRDLGNEMVSVIFGNFCLGAGGGHTHGFWGNKNGAKYAMDNPDGVEPELSLLRSLNLRTMDGALFEPMNWKSYQAWNKRASGKNMANMLSIQLAAMALNVEVGFVNEDAWVYAPGCGTLGLGDNFITVRELMDKSIDALEDDANGYTLSGHPQRAYQNCLMKALDDANNNRGFLQRSPCYYSFE